MKSEKYSMSFTTGGLFHRESVKIATLYLELGDWDAVRDKVFSDNILQTRTVETSKRLSREIISRLKKLSFSELSFLVHASSQEQAYLLWIAVCRRYKFIEDFAIEVLRERHLSLKTDLRHEDFDSFFNKKAEWHNELDQIRPATRNKLRQVMFKILHEADLLTANNTINTAMLSPNLLEAIHHGNRRDTLTFPAFESDLRTVAQ